ncbi:hypothetical protein [Planctomycetes bacterium TBK1r]|uniref:Uncharacterized protein n=1 Tax=Stieleria magnilauensis TaxID=2527963 RepID=A0ABX5Y1F1_9BACT|nr:hypothetical protein TBK1r_66360 [Planctomycetes bacterium TBK1r]
MNRSGGVVVFEVVGLLPPLGYVYRYPTASQVNAWLDLRMQRFTETSPNQLATTYAASHLLT